MKAVGKLKLTEDGNTTIISYEGEPQLSGRIASVGMRLVGGIAKQLAGQFFEKLNLEAQKTA
jgi:carbon monoxide dehydrogenase subunit G